MKVKFVVLSILLSYCLGCNHNIKGKVDKESLKEYRNYNFEIRMEIENEKGKTEYIINRTYFSLNNKNNSLTQNKEYLEQIFYDKQYNARNKFNSKPTDTKKYKLTRLQLDKIYSLASNLFNIDTLNLTSDTTIHEIYYDGYSAKISLLTNNAQYTINFNGISDKNTVDRYKILLSFIENIKRDPIYKLDKKGK